MRSPVINRDGRIWQTAKQTKRLAKGALFNMASARVLSRPFRLVVVLGLRRSGNHVFINWLQSQSHGPCLHWNDIPVALYPPRQYRRELRLNSPTATPVVVFSYEDCLTSDAFGGGLSKFLSDHDHLIETRHVCLMIRDPRNTMASRIKKWPDHFDDTKKADHIADLWRQTARDALSDAPLHPGFQTVPVYYNAFVTSRDYRADLSRRLDIRQGDRGLSEVPNFGHGSSFDGMEADGAPAQMDVFNRWRSYEDDPRFLRLFEDRSLDALDRQLAEKAGVPD